MLVAKSASISTMFHDLHAQPIKDLIGHHGATIFN